MRPLAPTLSRDIRLIISLASLLCAPLNAAPLAPGYQPLPFQPPSIGRYQLPLMGAAADGKVLDSNGKALTLHSLYGDKLVLLSFIYATCDDANGCPLATMVLHKIKAKLKQSPPAADSLRLITLSFNPTHDTPQAMAQYAAGFQDAGVEWRFLTTAAPADIQPILQAYGQAVEQAVDAQGRPTGQYSHLLRVFLIDRDRQIRNIYTVSVLHPDIVLADIHTLLAAKPVPPPTAAAPAAGALLRPGDAKSGYESSHYQTQSVGLSARRGQAAALLALARRRTLGLPPLPVPPDNPLSSAKIALGRKLFFDRRLSLNNTFSCAMCHIPEQGFTSQEQATAVGIEGRTVRRNAPTLYNVAFAPTLFHDGRESTLENQVWGPLLARNEMGNPSVGFVIDKLKRLDDYPRLFAAAFKRGPSMETVGQALASYQRTLVSANSPFDRWRYGGEAAALSGQAQQGFALFTGKAGCAQCHTVGAHEALFSDQQLHNTGVGFADSMAKPAAAQAVQVAPGVQFSVAAAALAAVSETKPNDLGRYEITQNPSDRWKYKTPSLRNVALTAPYMHNGAFSSLRDVVAFYNRGGEANENLDPLLKPLGLRDSEVEALLAFLQTLSGDSVEALVLDAYAAPVGDAD